jgi:hypothetical protein
MYVLVDRPSHPLIDHYLLPSNFDRGPTHNHFLYDVHTFHILFFYFMKNLADILHALAILI